jgi:hypothetical protein
MDEQSTGVARIIGSAPSGTDGSSNSASTPNGSASNVDASAPNEAGATTDAGAANDSGAMADAGPRPPSVVPLCVHARNMVKAILDRCCMSDEWDTVGYVDRGCDQWYGPSFAAGRMVPDPAGEATCFAAMDAVTNDTTCSSFKSALDLPAAATRVDQSAVLAQVFSPCDFVMKGTVALAGACAIDSDCLDGLTCIGAGPLDTPMMLGKCQAPQELGGLCAQGAAMPMVEARVHAPIGNHPECAHGYCNDDRCTAEKSAGDSCFDDRECGTGLLCVGRICTATALPNVGEPCTDRCAGDDVFCYAPHNAGSGVCSKERVVGEDCEFSEDCEGSCDRPAGASLGTCVSMCGSN